MNVEKVNEIIRKIDEIDEMSFEELFKFSDEIMMIPEEYRVGEEKINKAKC